MRRSRNSLCAAAAALVCGLLALAEGGCGAASTFDPVANAAVVSTKAPGFRMVFSMRISSPALPAAITGSGAGAFETAAHTGSLTLRMNFGAIPQVQQALGSSTLQIGELINGTTLYLKFPAALAKRLPNSKPWLKLDLSKAASNLGVPGLSTLMNNPASGDPSQLLGYLRETSGSVAKLGTDSVNGIPTTHYKATINLDRVPNGFPASSRAQVREAIAALERLANIHLLPVQVWIDSQHLVRRMKMAFDETISGQSLSIQLTVDIPQYGPQPVPAPPPADQVLDITGLAGAGTSGTTGG